MALAQTWSVALVGLEVHLVEVETDIAQGLPKTTLIGLPDASLSEARDRVRAAVVNSGERFPDRKVTIGLSPATLPKTGSHYDVAIALSLLTAAGAVDPDTLRRTAIIGELTLRISSWSARFSNFCAWKKCSDVGHNLPRSLIGYGAKFDSSPYSPLTL